jgi:signal transduction histidine kinase
VFVDWAPPVALAVAAAHELQYDRSASWEWVITQGLVWALAVRRRFPVTVLGWTLALGLVCWLNHELFTAYIAVLFALHAVAAHRSRTQAVAAAAAVEVGAVLVSFRFAPSGSVNDAVILLTALVLAFVLLGTTQHTQRQYLDVLEERAQQLSRELDQQAQLAAAEERRRIAREMHDIVAHSVSIMITLSEGAAIKVDDDPTRARESMRQVAVTGRQAISELRRVLSVLRGTTAETRAPQPTSGSLETLVSEVRAAGLPVTLKVRGDVESLPETAQLTIFRIVQEGLTNVRKHARRPSRVDVSVHSSASKVTVTVRDDGRADLSPSRDRKPPGIGLIGICERAELYAGSVTVGPCPGRGWMLSVDFDLTREGHVDPGTPGR